MIIITVPRVPSNRAAEPSVLTDWLALSSNLLRSDAYIKHNQSDSRKQDGKKLKMQAQIQNSSLDLIDKVFLGHLAVNVYEHVQFLYLAGQGMTLVGT